MLRGGLGRDGAQGWGRGGVNAREVGREGPNVSSRIAGLHVLWCAHGAPPRCYCRFDVNPCIAFPMDRTQWQCVSRGRVRRPARGPATRQHYWQKAAQAARQRVSAVAACQYLAFTSPYYGRCSPTHLQGDGSVITVEPGLIGGEVNRILAAHQKKNKLPIQYKIGPDPSSIDRWGQRGKGTGEGRDTGPGSAAKGRPKGVGCSGTRWGGAPD